MEKPLFIHRDLILRLYRELFTRWYAKESSFRDLIISAILTRDAKILLIGPPEAGKTTLVRLIAKGLSKNTKNNEVIYAKIIGAPEKTLQKVFVSTNIVKLLTQGIEEIIVRPIVKARIKFINEINRFSKAVQDGLLSLLEEKEIEYGGYTFKTPSYIAFADMNPYRGDIDRALKSRFHASAYISLADMKGSVKIIKSLLKGTELDLAKNMPEILSVKDLEEIWDDVSKVRIPQRVLLFANMLIWAFRACKYDKSRLMPGFMRLACAQCEFANELCSQIQMVPGERTIISLILLSKARAWFYGREEVNYDDIITLAPYVIAHRIELIPAVRSEYPNPWEWAKHAVNTIIRTKWLYEEGKKKIYGIWLKALSLSCLLLNCERDELIDEVLQIYYADLMSSGNKWSILKTLRFLAYGEYGGRGDLVLRQLYDVVKSRFEKESKELIKRIEPVVRSVIHDENITLSSIVRIMNELDNALPEDSKHLQEMLKSKLEEYTIRLSLMTPGIYEEIKRVLRKHGFDNKQISELLTGRIKRLENSNLIVKRQSNFIVIYAQTKELAEELRREIGV